MKLIRTRPAADHPRLVSQLEDPAIYGAARERVQRDLDAWRRGDVCPAHKCRGCAAGVCEEWHTHCFGWGGNLA